MRCAFTCLALALLLAGCGRLDVNRELAEAVALAEQGDRQSWEAALGKVDACVAAGAKSPAVAALHIVCLERTGDLPQAKAKAMDAVREYPRDFLLNYLLGHLLCAEKNYMEALGYLRTAYAANPQHLDALVLLADCAGKQNIPAAKGFYQALMEHDAFAKSHLAYNELAVWYVQQGRYPEAMSNFSQALQLAGGHPLVYLNIAVMYDRYMKKPKLARRFYVKFLTETGDSGGAGYPDRTERVKRRLRTLFTPQPR